MFEMEDCEAIRPSCPRVAAEPDGPADYCRSERGGSRVKRTRLDEVPPDTSGKWVGGVR